MRKVSLLVPCHNEVASLPLFYVEVKKVIDSLPEYSWEIMFVNDGSTDGTLDVMAALHVADSRVSYIDLSRNFGKEAAILAALDNCRGDCCVILDADLQDPPELITEMLYWWEQGYEDVYAKRRDRGREPYFRRKASLLFYKLLRKASDVEMLDNVGDFRLLDRKCIDSLCRMRESERYTKGLFCWIGFNKKEIEFNRGSRVAGNTNWNYGTLMKLALDGVFSFSTFPLRLSVWFGFVVALVAFVMMAFYVIKTIFFGDPIQGFPTLVTIILLLGGIQLISIGIVGEYVGRIFNEVKRRPNYIIRSKNLGS